MNFLNIILSRMEEILVSVALIIATILTFIEVVLRYGFGSSLGFTQELVVYLLIFTGLVGGAIGVRAKTHIGVDILRKNFPFKLQKVASVTALILSALFCLEFTILGYQHVQILIAFGQVTPELEIPMYIPKAIIPVAFGLMTFRFAEEAVKEIRTPAAEIFAEEEGGL